MAAGCPTVATRIAGNPELVVDGETGFLIPAGDVNLMKDKLGRLMNDPQGRLDMGRKGLNRVVELGMTVQEMVKNHEGIYTKATRRNFS
jgi:glycosyltransferase involved in cell wall biosynthesis